MAEEQRVVASIGQEDNLCVHPDIPRAVTGPLNTFGILWGVHKGRSAFERPAMQDAKAIPRTCRDLRHAGMHAVNRTSDS